MTKPILPPLHGPLPPRPTAPPVVPVAPAIPGEGWYVCIDQNVYGPYSIVQLIESAKDGRIGMDDTLLHVTATKNAWISITRLPEVAMHIRPAPPTISTVAVATVPRPAVPRAIATRQSRRTGGMKWLRDVVGPMISVILVVMGYLHFVEQTTVQNAQQSTTIPRQQSVSPREEFHRSEPPRRPSPTPVPRRTPAVQDGEPRPSPPVRPASVVDDEFEIPRRSTPKNNGDLGGLLRDEEPNSAQEPFLIIDLDLNAGFQVVDLPELPPNRQLTILRFTSPSQRKEIKPSDGVVTSTRPTLVLPYGDRSVFLEVRGIAANEGEITKVRIDCKTDFDWLGGDTLSLDRLRRKRIAMIKQRLSTVRFDAFCRTLANTFTDAKLELGIIQ